MAGVHPDSGVTENILNELLTVGASLLLDDALDEHDLRDASNCNRMSQILSNALRIDILPSYDLPIGEYVEDSRTGNTSEHIAKLYVRCAQLYQIVTRSINPIFVFESGDGSILERTIDELNVVGFPRDMNLTAVYTGEPCSYRAADPVAHRGLSLLRDLPDATGMLGGSEFFRGMLLDVYDPDRETFTDMTPRNAETLSRFREIISAAHSDGSGKIAQIEIDNKILLKYKRRVDRLRKKMATYQEDLMSSLNMVFSTITLSDTGEETITINSTLGGDIHDANIREWAYEAVRNLDTRIVPMVKNP